jgi:hypothetical protein
VEELNMSDSFFLESLNIGVKESPEIRLGLKELFQLAASIASFIHPSHSGWKEDVVYTVEYIDKLGTQQL